MSNLTISKKKRMLTNFGVGEKQRKDIDNNRMSYKRDKRGNLVAVGIKTRKPMVFIQAKPRRPITGIRNRPLTNVEKQKIANGTHELNHLSHLVLKK